MNKPRVILAGGSGFLGRELERHLSANGYGVIVLTRSPDSNSESAKDVQWDGKTLGDWADHFNGAKAVVNLTGKNVSCRYTPENRREINESRVDSVRVVEQAISKCSDPPRVLVQAASLAIYGNAGDRICDESAPSGDGFPVETCLLWEKAFNVVQTPATRRVLLRISFVLGSGGGALGTLTKLTRFYLGGTVGNGRQYISWIHIEDFNRMVQWTIENEKAEGIFNATGPSPVTNAEFMRELRYALHRPWSPPTPSWAVHIGSWLMGTEACLALTGRRGIPKRFVENGFDFKYSGLKEALQNLMT